MVGEAYSVWAGVDYAREEKNRKKLVEGELGLAALFAFFEISRGIVLDIARLHRRIGPPDGVRSLWQSAWNSCGRPGGGLKDRVRDWRRNSLRLPRLEPVPVAKRAPLREPDPIRFTWPEFEFDLRLPAIPPETIRNAAMATGTVIVIGGMLLLIPVGI